MELVASTTYLSNSAQEFLDQLKELNLLKFASEAAAEMEFDGGDELQEAVKRAMEFCISSGISLEGNFRRIYICSEAGLMYDWKLSLLAYRLVCMSGRSSNPCVAHLVIDLVKNHSFPS